jgi:putative nucleotidyltransferase with HDIG domain
VAGLTWESESHLRIGRLETLEVVLNFPSISRRHAEVAATEEGWVLRDLGSTNGTFLNGVRVGRADHRLRQGDRVQCGSLVLTVAALADLSVSSGAPTSPMAVECALACSWDKAVRTVFEQGGPARERLPFLLQIGRDFGHVQSLDHLLHSIFEDATTALGASRGAVWLLASEAPESLEERAVYPADQRVAPPIEYRAKMARRAVTNGESLICREPGEWEGGASMLCTPLQTRRKRLGVLVLDRPAGQQPFDRADLCLADALAASVSATVESLERILSREREVFLQTLTALAQTVELRDDYTGSHTQRVTDYALMIAEELQVPADLRSQLQIGAPLHDIGKIGISDHILRKQSSLSKDETEYMKSHTWKGAAILEAIPHLAPLVPIVRNHHERWDGTGYPDRLMEEEIPLAARIVAVADAFDAMTTDRPYRRCIGVDEAFLEIETLAGSHFCPTVARAFLNLRPRIEELLQQWRLLIETVPYSQLVKEMTAAGIPPSSRTRTHVISRAAIARELASRTQGPAKGAAESGEPVSAGHS